MTSCLQCKAWVPHQTPEWTPTFKGETFSRMDARNYTRETGKWLKGFCTLNAVWIETRANHYCGYFRGFKRKETLDTFLWGTYSERMAEYYE